MRRHGQVFSGSESSSNLFAGLDHVGPFPLQTVPLERCALLALLLVPLSGRDLAALPQVQHHLAILTTGEVEKKIGKRKVRMQEKGGRENQFLS